MSQRETEPMLTPREPLVGDGGTGFVDGNVDGNVDGPDNAVAPTAVAVASVLVAGLVACNLLSTIVGEQLVATHSSQPVAPLFLICEHPTRPPSPAPPRPAPAPRLSHCARSMQYPSAVMQMLAYNPRGQRDVPLASQCQCHCHCHCHCLSPPSALRPPRPCRPQRLLRCLRFCRALAPPHPRSGGCWNTRRRHFCARLWRPSRTPAAWEREPGAISSEVRGVPCRAALRGVPAWKLAL